MTLCPYCKRPMNQAMSFPPMRPRKQRIYQAVLEAGPRGIAPDDLLVRMYGDDEWPTPGGPAVLRVMICEMNKVLKSQGQRIMSVYRGRYSLVHLTEDVDVKETHSGADH